MMFQNERHEQQYHALLTKMKKHDSYHKSVAYLMALGELVPNDVFDFEKDVIKPEGLYEGWQTGSSRKATRLMFNLWNGFTQDEDESGDWKTSRYYAVDEIFSNHEFAPFFYEAIRIRFEWI